MNLKVLHGIEFASTHVREVGDDASDERIAVSDIRRCRCAYGSISARPRIQIAVGAALVSAFVVALGRLFLVLADGRRVALKIEVGIFTLSLIGAWMIWDACKKVHYIEVTTESGIKKLRLVGYDSTANDDLRRAAAEASKLTL